MWISRKEWEEKCDTNRALLKNKAEKDDIIEQLKITIQNNEKHIIQLVEDAKSKSNVIDIQKERIDSLNKDNDTLMKANQRLTEWINKIINEVGIYDVHDRRTINIPIYRNPVKAMSGNYGEIMKEMPNFLNSEEVIIPEIRFIRMK